MSAGVIDLALEYIRYQYGRVGKEVSWLHSVLVFHAVQWLRVVFNEAIDAHDIVRVELSGSQYAGMRCCAMVTLKLSVAGLMVRAVVLLPRCSCPP